MSTFQTDAVTIPEAVAERVRDHVRTDRENEVGGVLVGRLRDGRPEIHEALPALEAVGGAAQLTFTHEVWEDLLSTVDREHPELQIVGWYHSHPGHGIFLSTYDQFIHENFFSAPGMVALVVDPRDDDAFGWFGWREGALARLDADLPVDRPDRTEVPSEVAASAAAERADDDRANAIRDGAIVFLAVLAIFAIGSWFGGRGTSGLEDRLREADARADAAGRRVDTYEDALLVVCRAYLDEVGGEMATSQTEPVSPAPTPTAPVAPTEPEPTPQPEPVDPARFATAVCTELAAAGAATGGDAP